MKKYKVEIYTGNDFEKGFCPDCDLYTMCYTDESFEGFCALHCSHDECPLILEEEIEDEY